MEVKTDLKMASIFERFLIDFESFWERSGLDFGANLAPCWRLFGCLGVLRGSRGYKYASWSVLVLSWVRVVVSWRCLGASCDRLGSILVSQTSPSRVFNLTFHGFGIRFEPWELQKSLMTGSALRGIELR